MAAQEFFSMNPSTHIRTTTENRRFYDLLVDEKHIFSTKYQLYTFSIMVALRAGAKPDPATKNLDICLVWNVDKDNFAVAKGLVAHLCPEINNGSDLLKRMNEYADAGIAILRTDYENNDEDFDPSEYLE